MISLIEEINNAITRRLVNLHTCLIARITKVEREKGLISCQPVIARSVNNETCPLPEFTSVPVITLQGGSHYISFPIKINDYCLLFVNERCFDKWYEGQDNETPPDPRIFHYSDTFALVGVNNKLNTLPISDENETIITTESGDYIKIKDNNKIEIKTSGELVAEVAGNATINCSKAIINADTVDIGKGALTGIITQACFCSLTGGNHPDASQTVKGAK